MVSLDQHISGRIAVKLEEAAAAPAHYFKRLSGLEEFRLRVGDYRIIASIDHAQKHILVESIGHRSDVYKKLR